MSSAHGCGIKAALVAVVAVAGLCVAGAAAFSPPSTRPVAATHQEPTLRGGAAPEADCSTVPPPVPGMRVQLTNEAGVPVKVRLACVGTRTLGPALATIAAGESAMVQHDFLAEALTFPVASGDPFDVWYGSGWESAQDQYKLVIDPTNAGYLEYQAVRPPPPPSGGGGGINLWPRPRRIVGVAGKLRPLQADFTISYVGTSTTVKAMVDRYTNIIDTAANSEEGAFSCSEWKGNGTQAVAPALASDLSPSPPLERLQLIILNEDETLSAATNYSYSLSISAAGNVAQIMAQSCFGAAYGMETFSQLVVGGGVGSSGYLNVSAIEVYDSASYEHRGVMVDSGRRFAPVPMLKSMMDAMSYSKMNVLHLHLSDWPGVRMEVPGLPELTEGLNGQFYTADDIADIVHYGFLRGIRIVPEIDVPSHAAGFKPLEKRGLKFCDENKLQIYNDPAGVGLGFVKVVLTAVAKNFPERGIHVGGDETRNNSLCTWENIHSFERAIQDHIKAIGRAAIAWNEVYSDPKNTEPNALDVGTMVQNWHGADSVQTTSQGFETLSSNYNTQYLDQQCCAAGNAVPTSGEKTRQCFWEDISNGMTSTDVLKLRGGETAMWGDLYCAPPACPDVGQFSWMYAPSADAQFSSSWLGMVWPRAAASGGSFWNYNASLASGTTDFTCAVEVHNARLQARGVDSCPNGCSCDWGSRCDKPYGAVPPIPANITLISKLDKNAKVRIASPCQKGYGADIATIEPGGTAVVHQDFVVETTYNGGVALGDPFSVWFGGPGWRGVNITFALSVDPSTPSYVDYTIMGPTPP